MPVFLMLIALIALMWGVLESLVIGFSTAPGSFAHAVLHLLWFAAMSFPESAMLRVASSVSDRGSWARADITGTMRVVPAFTLTKFLYLGAVVLGLALLVVPGLYVAGRYGVWGFVHVRESAGPLGALVRAQELSAGLRWRLLGFGLLATLLNLVGAAVLGLGLLITIPWTILAAARIDQQLRQDTGGAAGRSGG